MNTEGELFFLVRPEHRLFGGKDVTGKRFLCL